MKNLIKFLKVDIRIQQVLIALTFLSFLIPYLIWIPLVLLGAWQIFSGIYIGVKLKDSNRAFYLLFCVILLLLMDTLPKTTLRDDYNTMMLGIAFIILPIITACWYLRYSFKTLDKLAETKNEFFTELEMEEVLDSEEILN